MHKTYKKYHNNSVVRLLRHSRVATELLTRPDAKLQGGV